MFNAPHIAMHTECFSPAPQASAHLFPEQDCTEGVVSARFHLFIQFQQPRTF